MKRVLVLNGDSFVGERVIRQFYAAREYEIEITRQLNDGEDLEPRTLAFRKCQGGADAGDTCVPGANATSTSVASGFGRVAAGGAGAALLRSTPRPLRDSHSESARTTSPATPTPLSTARSCCTTPPPYLTPYVTSVIPSYREHPVEFCECVLENDIIIAVVDQDPVEAECAIKALMNTQYEVEKTFVLMSTALTWANTLIAERAVARQTRLQEREAGRRAYWEESLANLEADGVEESDEEMVQLRQRLAEPHLFRRDEELPAELREPIEDLSDDELVPFREFSEEEYVTRVPYPRYQHTKTLEHVVKRANSATLHTYVVFAGLPYGAGEGPLYHYFLSAFQQESTSGKPADGRSFTSRMLAGIPKTIADNIIPTIHVEDLAALLFKVGSAYDVHEERYLFAVDRGNLTVRSILQAIEARLGNPESIATASPLECDAPAEDTMVNYLDAVVPAPQTVEELRAKYENDTNHPLFSSGSDELRCFLLSSIRAEPNAALSFLPEERWTAIEGFGAVIDKVVYQFKKTRELQPCRVLVTGPPMSGSETVGLSLAAQYGVPFLTEETATAAFEAHVAELRAELVDLLAKRMQRRWERGHMRRVKEVMAEREAAAARLAEEREERRQRREEEREARRAAGEEVDSDDDDDEEEEEGEESEDEDNEAGDGDGSERARPSSSSFTGRARRKGGADGKDGAISELSLVFSDDKEHTERRLVELLTERYIQGYTEDAEDGDVELVPEDDEEQEEDEQMFTQAEEDVAQEAAEQEEEGNAGALRGRMRALAIMRSADLQEKVRIRALRLAYRLAVKAMSLKLVNGMLPRSKGADDEEEDEEDAGAEEEQEGDPSMDQGEFDGEEGEHDDEEDEDANDEENGEEEDEENDGHISEVSSTFSSGRRNRQIAAMATDATAKPTGKKRKGKVYPTESVVEYLDEAKAFFMRWRLRQPDCRNQGYVLHNFPSTVRQACLLFYASSAPSDNDDADSPPVFVPAAVEDVPLPIDADFPFANLQGLSEEDRRSLEDDLRADRFRIIDALEEGVLAAVDESYFPDHVIVLEDKDETLQALAAATLEEKKIRAEYSDGNNARVCKQIGEAEGESSPLTGRCSSGGTVVMRKTTAGPRPDNKRKNSSTSAMPSPDATKEGTPGLLHEEPSSPSDDDLAQPASISAAEKLQKEKLMTVADGLLPTGDVFYKQLSRYRTHHKLPNATPSAGPALPTESLVTWLQSVQTHAKTGATAEPILVHAARKHLSGANGVDDEAAEEHDGEDEDGEENEDGRAPPSTARSAQVDILPSPPRDAVSIWKELLSVLSTSASVTLEGTPLPLTMVIAPNRPVAAAAITASSGGKTTSSGFSPTAEPLQWLADKLTRTILPPPTLEARGLVPARDKRIQTGLVNAPQRAGSFRHIGSTTTNNNNNSSKAHASSGAPASLSETPSFGLLKRTGGDSGEHAANVAPVSEADEEEMESAMLAQLRRSESTFHEELERREEADMRFERNMLRGMQLKEQCLGVWAAAELPKETYLMKFVLPHLTPAMQSVVRLRPEDPVTALADLLYNHPVEHAAAASKRA